MADLTRASINTMSRPSGGMARPPIGPGGPGASGGGMGGMTPKEIIAIFLRHIPMMIIFTFLGLVVGGVAWFLCLKYIPKYTAVGYVRVESPQRQDPTKIPTTIANKDIMYQNRVTMASLMQQDALFGELLRDDDVKKTNWYRNFSNPQVEGVKELQDNFRASPQRESQFVSVSMKTKNAKESVVIVDQMITLFLNTQSNRNKAEVQAKLQNLEQQESLLKTNLRSANNTLDEIRSVSGFTGLEADDEFEHTFNRKEEQVVLELDILEAQMSELEEQIKTIQKRVETIGIDVQTQSQTEQDTIVISLKQQEASLRSLLLEKQANLGDDHRVIREIRKRIDQVIQEREDRYLEIARITRESLLASANDSMRALESRRQTLLQKQEASQKQLRALDDARSQYQIALENKEDIKDRLDELTGQVEAFRIMLNDPEAPKVFRAGKVQPPLEPSFPKWKVFFPGGFMLGFMLGAGIAFLVEFMNDKMRTPKDIASTLKIPLLGMVCHTNEDKEIKGISNVCHIIKETPYSITSEFYRRIRTNLKKTIANYNKKVILITSGAGAEGRTTVAANLASSFEAEGKSVVFVDANFRRPASLSIFPKSAANMPAGTQQVSGLSTYLTGGCNLSDIIRKCEMTGVNVIDSGPLPKNPSELLESDKMDEMLRQLSSRFDFVVIDGPPLLVADSKILAIKADGCVLVVNAMKTRKGAAQRAIRELREINADIFGCALVAVRSMKGGYFDEMFRSYRDYQQVQIAGTTA